MRILVAYDGSVDSEQLFQDLPRAGLPEEGVSVLAASIAEVWMPPGNGAHEDVDEYPKIVREWTEHRLKIANSVMSEAEALSKFAAEKIGALFPKWEVDSFSTYGSPAWEILAKSVDFNADLIVIGAKGHGALGRMIMGSVSQKVLTEANCSVRIARAPDLGNDDNPRIVIGYDGSLGSEHAVDWVAARNWKPMAEVRLVAAVQSVMPDSIGRFVLPASEVVSSTQAETAIVEELARPAIKRLEKTGLSAEFVVETAGPREAIVEHAARWNADSIFVGANSYTSRLQAALIGGTAAAIAARSQCSVEAVRVASPGI
ncbi:MAG: universal stress protein [Pyrinomonadaceae bacterium]